MANSTITADLPRRTPPPRPQKLPASQRCIGLLNGEASYPGKGCASDITYNYMAFVMADGTVRMSGTNNNHELAMAGQCLRPPAPPLPGLGQPHQCRPSGRRAAPLCGRLLQLRRHADR